MTATFLGMSPTAWHAIASMLLTIAVAAGVIWAMVLYRRLHEDQASRWLHGVFTDLYVAGTFADVRTAIELDYAERVEPLLERRLGSPRPAFAPDEVRLLRDLDTLLAYLEHVLFLEDDRHIPERDRRSVCALWFSLLCEDDRRALRAYAARRGFSRLASALEAFSHEELGPRQSLYDRFLALGEAGPHRRAAERAAGGYRV